MTQGSKENHIAGLQNKLLEIAAKSLSEETKICQHFGCGQILTRTEQLYGNHCIIHNIQGETIFKKRTYTQIRLLS